MMDRIAMTLVRSEPLRRPVLQEIVTSLCLPAGSQGLDVGCGVGLQTLLLAEAVGQGGHVTGLDASPSFLEIAGAFARQADRSDRISFQQGDWTRLPFEAGAFDWVWSADAAGYAAHEPILILQELARVVKPGGQVVLAYWSSQTLLPGYPALEARLNATPAGIAPFAVCARPETHFMRTLDWMDKAGLVNTRVATYARSISAPLDGDLQDALSDLLAMRWGMAETDVSPQDWREYQRLSQATSPDFILIRPDYYAFCTYSVFSGSVP